MSALKPGHPAAEGMSDYLLVEPSSLEDLKGPVRGSARLKYTCFDVSGRYIAVGSNTGSVYIFDKMSLRHLQVVFTEEEPSSVNNVKLCATNKTVAFSMINGLVQVMELNIDKRQKPERLRSVSNHLHQTVSCIHWDPSGQKLYTADNTGNVVVANIPSSKMKNLVQVPVEVILNLSVPVIQLDFYQDKLLVSTRTECFLCNTAKHNYLQIGTKPRDGLYGACFLQGDNTVPVIYCARPGSRLWEVDIEGNVQHTHQFKQLLAIPPVHVLSIRENTWRLEEREFPPLGINFPVLRSLSNKFILTWNKTKLILLDPLQEQPKVILWTEFQTEILETGIHGTEVYIFLTSGEIRKLILMSASQTVSLLVSRKSWQFAAQVCGTYSQSIMANHSGRQLSRKMLKDLVQNIHNGCQSEHEGKVMEIFEKISAEAASSSETEGLEYSRSRSSSGASIVRLDSGIYQIKHSKSSASLDSWNETGSQDEVDSGTSSPTKPPSGVNEVIVNIVNESELEKDFNSNDKSKRDQERSSVDMERSGQLGENQDMPLCTINDGHVLVESFKVEYNTELNKESLNRLINSDDIFADDEVLIPRGSIKLVTKKPELNGDMNDDSFEHANSTQNGLIKEEIIDIVSIQDQDLIPLIVKKSESDGHRKSSTRKKAVTVDIDGGKPKDEKHRRRNSRSKLKEIDRKQKKQESSHSSKEMISNSAPNEFSNNIPVTQSNSSPLKRTESCPAMTEKSSLIQPNAAELPSPSVSPLSQSWEEPTKMTLTSVKGSLQSKFANTKKKFLDTIKEKKRMSSSPKDSKESPVQIQVTSCIPEEQELKQDIPLSNPEQESPILGFNEFIQKTVKTRAKLQDFSVVLNPDALWDTLAEWIISLNTVMKNLNTQKYLKVLQSKHSEMCRLRLATESSKEENKSDVVEDFQTSLGDTEKDKDVMDTECEQPSSPMLELSDFEKFSVQDFCNVQDPLQLSSEMFTLVKDLTRQCFNSRCFNNIVGSIEPDLGAIVFCDICQNCYQKNEINIASVLNTSVRLSEEHVKTDVFDNPGDKNGGISIKAPVSSVLESVVNTQGPCKSTVNEKLSLENNFSDSSCGEVSESQHGIPKIRALGMNGVTAPNTSDIAAFVRCYFFLLDKTDLIQNVYSRGSTMSDDDKFKVWTAWMQSLQVKNEVDSSFVALDQKNKEEAISLLELNRHDHLRALYYVYKLFKMFPVETVSFCVKCDHLQPMDIVYLCQHYQQDETVLLDQYMCGRYVELQSSRRLHKSNLITEERVALTWLRTLLGKTVISQQLKDEDGNPWLSSHCMAWVDRDKVDFVLHNISEDHREKCLSMCTKSGYWKGCLILLKKQQKWREMATMIFCLGDLQLFNEMDLLPETISDWKSFVELFQLYSDNHQKKYHSKVEKNHYRNPTANDNLLVHKEASDNQSSSQKMSESSDLQSPVNNSDINVPNKESSCGEPEDRTFHERKSKSPESGGLENENLTQKETTELSRGPVCGGECISWGEVTSLMLQHLDESVCVGIWTEMDVPEGCMDQSVYQSSITTALNHRHQRNVMHNLLEKIDSYLWAKKPNTLMPELQYAVSVERKSRGSRKERTNEQLMALLSEKPADGRRYMEDSECHWGITTNILKCCRMCNISLSESISHVEPGILVFDCGHGFHKYCCQGRICQLCS